MPFETVKYMSILPMLQLVNVRDTAGELIPAVDRCRQIPSGEYDLCPVGVRLYYLYCNSQREDTGGKISPRWERLYTKRQVEQNSMLEHIRYAVQMKIIRPAYMEHVTTCCCADDERPSRDILPVLTAIARCLVAQNVCEAEEIAGHSLTYWYTRRGDPVTMQELYIQENRRNKNDGRPKTLC